MSFLFFPCDGDIYASIPQCDPNDVLDIENLSNSSDSRTPNITRQSVPPYLHTHPSLITLLSLSLPSYGCIPGNKTEFLASQNLTEEEFQEHPTINWDAILWVRRPLELWVVQVILAMVSLTEALLLAYLGYKVRHPIPLLINSVFIYGVRLLPKHAYFIAHRKVLQFFEIFHFFLFSQNNQIMLECNAKMCTLRFSHKLPHKFCS